MRARENAKDDFEHVRAHVTPANRKVLSRVLPVFEHGQSLREIARQADMDHTQVARAFTDARAVFADQARRIKRPAVVGCKNFSFNPRGVPWELVMETHKGAVIPLIGVDQRTKQASRRIAKEPDARPEIERLPRPRERRYVQHAVFGRAIVLRDRESDSHGRVYDLAFDDGIRRTILAEYVQVGQ